MDLSASRLPPKDRSCATCHRRKVKCDRRQEGCLRCKKANQECSYPELKLQSQPARRYRLLARISKLEDVIHDLDATETETLQEEDISRSPGSHCLENKSISVSNAHKPQTRGRLYREGGRTRFISNDLWAALTDEVQNLKHLVNEDTQDQEEDQLDLFGAMGQHFNPRTYYMIGRFPHGNVTFLSQKAFYLWEIFLHRVDPLVKILHKPTMQTEFVRIVGLSEHFSIPIVTQVLIYAVYFCSITSMGHDECFTVFNCSKTSVLKLCKDITEQALLQAGLLTTEEPSVLKAFTLYLAAVRRSRLGNPSWALTGLALRLAQTMGLHCDGVSLGLSPFDAEMRCRLWWQICLLDTYAAEDNGLGPNIPDAMVESRMPLNINDSDIMPEDPALPLPKQGLTEMIYSIVRYELLQTAKRLQGSLKNSPANTSESKRAEIQAVEERLEHFHLRHLDGGRPFAAMVANGTRLIVSKLRIQLEFTQKPEGDLINHDSARKADLYHESVRIVEYSHRALTDQALSSWTWNFCNHVLWYGMANLCLDLGNKIKDVDLDRGWRLFDQVCSPGSEVVQELRRHKYWPTLEVLMQKANCVRPYLDNFPSTPLDAYNVSVRVSEPWAQAGSGETPGPDSTSDFEGNRL